MICYGRELFSQDFNKSIDSLMNRLPGEKVDKGKVDIYNDLAFYLNMVGKKK